MSKNTKIALGIVAGIVATCACLIVGASIALDAFGKVLEENVAIDDPEKASTLARTIVDYDLPAGYEELASFNIGIVKMVMIGHSGATGNGASPLFMIAEMTINGSLTEEEMQRQVEQMKGSFINRNLDLRFVEEEMVTIRDQEVPLLYYEGHDEQGVPMKQVVSGFFEGKDGSVMLMVFGEEAGWDQRLVDDFINSIR